MTAVSSGGKKITVRYSRPVAIQVRPGGRGYGPGEREISDEETFTLKSDGDWSPANIGTKYFYHSVYFGEVADRVAADIDAEAAVYVDYPR